MGRPTRIQFPGACYFITLQGNNRQDIFLGNQDRRHFLALLRGYRDRFDMRVYAYCLMNSSAEIVLETRQANLSSAMQGFNTVYTKHFNRQHGTVGHVFQGRYRALLVDKERCLVELSCYVHLTPMRAGLKERPWRYLWSSCPAYVEWGSDDDLVDTEPVLKRFARNRLKQSVRYLRHLKTRMRSGIESLPMVAGSGVIGGAEFAAAVGRQPAAAPAGAASQERIRDIIEEALSRGIAEPELYGRDQRRGLAAVRKAAIYRLWKEARLGVTQIGRMFNRTPAAISQLVRSVEAPTA